MTSLPPLLPSQASRAGGLAVPGTTEGAIKFVDEFRDAGRARSLARALAEEARPGRRYHFMEFCGGHTHAIARYGVEDLLPASVRMIHGPG